MTMLFLGLAGLCALVAFVAWIFVLIAAFQDEIWKGIACIFCGIYALYYMLTEYNGQYQIPVLAAYVLGTAGSYGFSFLAHH